MCTLLVAHRVWEELPLLVAANRDERLDRASSPPAPGPGGPAAYVAPRDLAAGGTWIGLNADGVFAGLTNRFGRPPEPARRTRGELVLRALAHRSAAGAARELGEIDPAGWNGFHLVVADPEQAFLVWADGETRTARALEPGFHVVTERSFGAAPTAREPWAALATASWSHGPPPGDEEIRTFLATHRDPSIEGLCVHREDLGYGTRSSTILRIRTGAGARDLDPEWLEAAGPPCVTPHVPVDLSSLLARPS